MKIMKENNNNKNYIPVPIFLPDCNRKHRNLLTPSSVDMVDCGVSF